MPEALPETVVSRVLLVEDDATLADLIQTYLKDYDIQVIKEARGDRALDQVHKRQPDLVVLDVMLPGKNGFDVCKEMRAAGISVPILMLTARDEDIDRVLGLELGADDYLQKPIQPRVLLAHIRAALRRSGLQDRAGALAAAPSETLAFGSLRIDAAAREVVLGGRIVELTTAEFDLLWLLATHAGKVLSRSEILLALRSLDYDGTDRSVYARIYRLRRKLGDLSGGAERIKTVRSIGYLFSTHW